MRSRQIEDGREDKRLWENCVNYKLAFGSIQATQMLGWERIKTLKSLISIFSLYNFRIIYHSSYSFLSTTIKICPSMSVHYNVSTNITRKKNLAQKKTNSLTVPWHHHLDPAENLRYTELEVIWTFPSFESVET